MLPLLVAGDSALQRRLLLLAAVGRDRAQRPTTENLSV